jgi:uncharacterized protein YneF (UPF0154 family)
MGIYLSLLSVVLLAMVAGLLLALWFQLKAWKAVAKEAPLLTESLTSQLMAARTGLADLKKALVAQGPDLERLISEAGKTRVELQFLLQRAEVVAQKLDAPASAGMVVPSTPVGVAPVLSAQGESVAEVVGQIQQMVEEVSSTNGVATAKPASQTVEQMGQDPLEELLAGLNRAAETPLEDQSAAIRRRRVGPVTQAELDLQQQLRGATIKKVAA